MTGESGLTELAQAIEWLLTGQMDQARVSLKKIVALDPTNDEAWVWFIDTLSTQSAREKALSLWHKMDPQNQIAQGGLSRVSEARKDYERTYRQSHQFLQQTAEITETVTAESLQATIDEVSVFSAPASGTVESTPVSMGGPTQSSNDHENAPTGKPVINQMQTDVIQVIQRETSQKSRGNSNLMILLIASFIFMVLSLAAIGYFISRWYGYDIPSLFEGKTACTCENTEAYMLRVGDRLRIWQTNQSLMMNITNSADISGNIEAAKKVYQQEEEDVAPRCMNDVHELMVLLLGYHVKYAEALSANDTSLVDYYLLEQEAMQDQLKAEFIRISAEPECKP